MDNVKHLSVTGIPATNFKCYYCKYSWVLFGNSLKQMENIRDKIYCYRCADEISRRIEQFNRESIRGRSMNPVEWPPLITLINEAYCCYCPGKLCRYNVKLSECAKGLILIYRYNEHHAVCIKCITKLYADYIRVGFRWRCKCIKLNNE